jgi:hypothetical protein
VYVIPQTCPLNPRAELTQSTDLDDAFQLGVQNYLSYYRQLISNGLMEWLHLDIYGQAAVQLVLDNSQEQVIQRLAQERTSVRGEVGVGTLPEGGGIDGHGNLEPLENDPAAFAMIESHLNGFSHLTERIGPPSQHLEPQDTNNYDVQGLIEQPGQGGYLNVAQPIITVPESDPYALPVQNNSDTSKEVDRTILASYDEDYVFQS